MIYRNSERPIPHRDGASSCSQLLFRGIHLGRNTAYENHQPKSGDSGIIKAEKIMEDTEISVARWAEGNRSFSLLSLTS